METDYLQLAKDQNRAITTLRRMMQLGYFTVFVPDRNILNAPLKTGLWALCKYPTPSDKLQGVLVFESYDVAYDAGRHLAWGEKTFYQFGEVHSLDRLDYLSRKILSD